jgi:hypothetical protein
MRFEGDNLISILRQQTVPLMVCDAAGAPVTTVPNPNEASERFARGFFGVGNKKRIRYVQALNPSVWGAGWRGGSHTTVKVPARNGAGDAVSAPRHEHRLLRFLQ